MLLKIVLVNLSNLPTYNSSRREESKYLVAVLISILPFKVYLTNVIVNGCTCISYHEKVVYILSTLSMISAVSDIFLRASSSAILLAADPK